jgi:hypothetical protein
MTGHVIFSTSVPRVGYHARVVAHEFRELHRPQWSTAWQWLGFAAKLRAAQVEHGRNAIHCSVLSADPVHMYGFGDPLRSVGAH